MNIVIARLLSVARQMTNTMMPRHCVLRKAQNGETTHYGYGQPHVPQATGFTG